MIKKIKRERSDVSSDTPSKKLKETIPEVEHTLLPQDSAMKSARLPKPSKASKSRSESTKFTSLKPKTTTDKTNWAEFKRKKKELKLKRKQAKDSYDVIVEAKKIAEVLRRKHPSGGKEERIRLVGKLHYMLVGKEHYRKMVLSHDMARVVQYLLKFAPETIRNDICKEIIPISLDMIQSKYGRYCFKNVMKYGSAEKRSACLQSLYGHAVKLASHAVSADVFEYAYSTWATPQQKCHFIQEFFGDMYKHSKDDCVKHLRDTYQASPNMRKAVLSATKANLARILNKQLLNSSLVQSVLHQYLMECTPDERSELIGQLASHVVILSNSKDGARVAMQCIWHGSNKDRKVAMKALKEHVVDLCKHEHGHCTIITVLDAADDTVLVNKMIVGQLLPEIQTLAADEWGRKVLLWLVAPANMTHFHPVFIKEIEAGRKDSTSKKDTDVRRRELLQYILPELLKSFAESPRFWLSAASLSMVMLAALKSTNDADESSNTALEMIVKVISDPEWKIKEGEADVYGIEHAGIHMVLKKLIQHKCTSKFNQLLLSAVSNETLQVWLTFNRGCFLLIVLHENGNECVQQAIKEKLQPYISLIKKQKTPGAEILLKKCCL